jgi:hypothetical protein
MVAPAYAWLITPLGSTAVVMVRPEEMVSDSAFEVVCCGVELSVAVTVTLNVPALLGVPPNAPAALRFRPVGRPVADQE